MDVVCVNDTCSYKWFYRGESKKYICCPKCSYRFNITRGIEKYKKTMLTYVNICYGDYERITFKDGFSVLVPKDDKRLDELKQFALEEIEEENYDTELESSEEITIKELPMCDFEVIRQIPFEPQIGNF